MVSIHGTHDTGILPRNWWLENSTNLPVLKTNMFLQLPVTDGRLVHSVFQFFMEQVGSMNSGACWAGKDHAAPAADSLS